MSNLLTSLTVQTHCKLRGMASGLGEEKVFQCLAGAYVENVRKYGRQFIQTPDTIAKLQKALRWLKESHCNGLLLYGRCGTGKTVMARSLSRLLRYGRSYDQVIFKTSGELTEIFQHERDYFHTIAKAEVVIIDDLGCEPSEVNIYGTIYAPFREFLHERYARNLITVVSTNLDDKTLKEQYGERVWDRMCEMFDRIVYTEESYRSVG